MEGFRRYPAGVQDFEEIRKSGFVYVDKTRYIYDLAHTQGNAIFLSRPRLFGKSLLCSTLKYYFQGRRDLSEGLAIDQLATEWTQHPVLHFSMSSAKSDDPDKVLDNVSSMLRRYDYLIPYWNDPRPVIKVGAVLDRATRTIREWKVVF